VKAAAVTAVAVVVAKAGAVITVNIFRQF